MDDYAKMMSAKPAEELFAGKDADVVMAPAADGLPAPVTQAIFDTPPGLSPETLVCMADTSSFVHRNLDGEVMREYAPFQVKRLANGTYMTDAEHIASDQKPIRVEPIRPACKHYLRQATDISFDRTARFFQRSCLAQRSDTGEYVSLRDCAIYACTLREPRHIPSEKQLDDFDASLLAQELNRKSQETFDVDAELAKADLGVLGSK